MAALSQVEQGDIRQTPSHCFMSELSTHSFQQGPTRPHIDLFSFARSHDLSPA